MHHLNESHQITRETEPQLEVFCHQMKFAVPRLGSIQSSCCPKGSYGNLQTTQAISKDIGGSPHIDSQALLLKTTPAHFIEHGEIELALPRAFTPTDYYSRYWKVLCMLPKEKGKH